MGIERAARRENSEDGFTIVELVIALAILALVMAPMARVFWSSMRTAGAASHRTDGSSISSREIEAMHAIPYAQVGFYDDQPGVTSSYEGFTTVSLGDTSPSTGPLVPQIAPQSSPIVQGNVSYSLERHIVWVDAHDASSTYTQAYKRLTVIVSWSDQVGPHTVRQDSLLYPGGQGKFQGAMGGSAPTTSTTTSLNPGAPVLSPVTGLAAPAGETQVPLTWTQPGSGAPVTSFTIEYSTNSTFPVGNFSVVTGLAPSVASYTVPSLSAGATYYFAIIAYAGSNSAVSNVQSFATLASAAPTCTLGQLNVTGATTLSTTGTILENNGKVSENLALSWTTSGACTHSYTVKAVDPTGGTDPSSPYALFGSAGTYNQTVYSSGSKNWGIGLHTFTVWDQTTNSATAVVKTFKICAHRVGIVLRSKPQARRNPDEHGYTVVEVMISTAILLLVLALLFQSLVSLTRNEDRSQRLVSNEQNVRFELDQLAREIRATNPLVPLLNASTASAYQNQIEMVLGPTGGAQTVVRWTYDTTNKKMVRQLMSSTYATASVVAQSFYLTSVRNFENATPVFTYYGQHNEDLVEQSLENGGNVHDAANCAVRVHIELISDSNPGPLPFTQTQDVEVRNRLPGNVGCG